MSAPREFRGARKITAAEKEALLATIAKIIDGQQVAGICIYGSQVAGYARPDSDYDLIIAIKGYRQRVRYNYLKGQAVVSALVIDSDLLLKDAQKASLGEFAVGRFLNVYEPIYGVEYFDRVETAYKKRVALEAITELVADYGDFSRNLVIPIEYILYQKLKKMAVIYPPALYSYVKTYSGDVGKQNLALSCMGFTKALQEFSKDSLISLDGNSFRISGAATKKQLAKLQSLLAVTERGLRQYAAHGYAGRVRVSIVRKELLSKISRSKAIEKVPQFLKNPKTTLQIDEGHLIMDGAQWRKHLLAYLLFGEKASILVNNVGGPYALLKEYTIKEGNRTERFAVKAYRDLKSVKWFLLNFWTANSRKFEITPLARLTREYVALRKFRSAGIDVPSIVAIVLSSRILITEFIEGKDLGVITKEVLAGKTDDYSPITKYGEILAKIHSLGYALGDAKPNNAIKTDSKIFITDLEQVRKDGDRAWDISVFIYYSLRLNANGKHVRDFVKAFLEGYLVDGSKKIVQESLKVKYYEPFFPILAPIVVMTARDEIVKIVKS